MAEQTRIAWTDSTFNPWIGCTKVGPGCDHCYAERDFDLRKGRVKWGAGNLRSRTSTGYWNKPRQWEQQHSAFFAEHGRRRRVFCASLADVFDNEVPAEWRDDLMSLIRETPSIDWLLLSKRITNVQRMVPDGLPTNVWLAATMVNRDEFLRDLDRLLNVPAVVRFVSAEPLLGDVGDVDLRGIDWLIVGGESGPHCRALKAEWVRKLRHNCRRDNVAFFFKQWGGTRPTDNGCLLDGMAAREWPVSVLHNARGCA